MILIVPGKKNPKLIVRGDEFVINRRLENRTMWICPSYYRTKCKSRAITFGRNLKLTCPHNHPPSNPTHLNAVKQYVTIIDDYMKKSIEQSH